MKKFCDIDIIVRAEDNNGGGTYVKDIPLEDAVAKCKEIESIMRDFSIANDCNMAFLNTDEYGSFIAVDVCELSCIHVVVTGIRDYGPKTLRENVEGILQRIFKIDNPAGLLEKIQDKEIEHAMEDEEWAYGHNQVSDYRHLTEKDLEEQTQWYGDMADAIEKDAEKHPEKYKGGRMKL